MAKKKVSNKTGLYIGIAVGVLVIGGGIWYFLKKRKEKQQLQRTGGGGNIPASSSGGGTSSGGGSSSSGGGLLSSDYTLGSLTSGGGGGIFSGGFPSITYQGASNQTSASDIGCGGKYNKKGFPLAYLSCGGNVKKLQKYLGITADGKFGRGTESAVKGRQNAISLNPIGWSSGYGKVSQSDFNALPL